MSGNRKLTFSEETRFERGVLVLYMDDNLQLTSSRVTGRTRVAKLRDLVQLGETWRVPGLMLGPNLEG